MKGTDTATFRQRASSSLIFSRDFILPSTHEQIHEKSDLELFTWIVIKSEQ